VHRPATALSAQSRAIPEEVWKLLYDPARFPEWWGRNRHRRRRAPRAIHDVSRRVSGLPDGSIAATRQADRRVTVSCIVSDLRFEWRLEPSGAGTQITVEVEIPEREAQRLDSQREKISASLTRLAGLAAAS
jgi:uncharacterized protein YndB with AHSA1/START domain